jgi:uncharacterized protein (DUF433 family)
VYNLFVMSTLETTQSIPLACSEDGTIRLAGTRVSLDSVVHHFKLGATAEEIAQKFAPVELADVYAAITYYLTHRDAVEEYLHQQEEEGDAMQARIESAPGYQEKMSELRERILARRSSR